MIKKRQKTLVRLSFFCNFARRKKILLPRIDAAVAQLVEHQLPKLRVAGSSPVCRSKGFCLINFVIIIKIETPPESDVSIFFISPAISIRVNRRSLP